MHNTANTVPLQYKSTIFNPAIRGPDAYQISENTTAKKRFPMYDSW